MISREGGGGGEMLVNPPRLEASSNGPNCKIRKVRILVIN